MGFVTRIASAAALGAAAVMGSGLYIQPAQAGYVVTLAQEGSNVVATGSGTIDLADLIFVGSGSGDEAGVSGGLGIIVVGPVNFQPSDGYGGFSGPTSFGSLGLITASSGSGDRVGIDQDSGELFVPANYVSGSTLSSSSTWDNKTFTSLGVTPGTYVWNWGSGAGADSFTLRVGAAVVPEPAGLAVLVLPVGFLMLFSARHRRRSGFRLSPE
jgi:hypothetical protein